MRNGPDSNHVPDTDLDRRASAKKQKACDENADHGRVRVRH